MKWLLGKKKKKTIAPAMASPTQKPFGKELKEENKELQERIALYEKEIVHWKSIALNFRKFHQ